MNNTQWNIFSKFKTEFKYLCQNYSKQFENTELKKILHTIALDTGTPDYNIENTFVYNHSLDYINKNNIIKYILIADNPGKNEQLTKNQKYLIGHSGTLASNFFTNNIELCCDFRDNVIILNKTPLHTAKTTQLKKVIKYGIPNLRQIFIESQEKMAEYAFLLQQTFNCELWIVGYSELHKNKIFETYASKIIDLYQKLDINQKKVFLFQHFSMNRFTIDLKQNYNAKLNLTQNLLQLGEKHRKEILGF